MSGERLGGSGWTMITKGDQQLSRVMVGGWLLEI